jgi:hypothetical protein
MARLVGKRTGAPPYLLVVFVFLFVLATVLAFLMYQGKSKAEAREAQLSNKLDKVAGPADGDTFRDTDVAKRHEEITNDPNGRGKTVCQEMRGEIETLIENITGQRTDTFGTAQRNVDKAGEVINKYLKSQNKPQIRAALAMGIEDAYKIIAQKDQELTGLKGDLEKLRKEKSALETNYDGEVKKLRDQVARIADDANQARRDASAGLDKFTKTLDAAEASFKQSLADKETTIAGLTKMNENLNRKIQLQGSEIEDLKRQIVELTGRGIKSEAVVTMAGKIERLVEGSNTCYINVGADKLLTPGLTLTVFPSTGVPASGENKGAIEITNVYTKTSECRINLQKKDEPIMPGDLVANVVFGTAGKLTFAVEGWFDTRGEGKAVPQGAEDVKATITRLGGKLATELDYRTDYLVLGDPPPTPPKPTAGAGAIGDDAYQKAKEAVDHFQKVYDQARELKIPILNYNRFQGLIGQSLYKMPKPTP